jgi:hypothetical protein
MQRHIENIPAGEFAIASAKRPPLVWLLLGDRHGDNAQLKALDATLLEAFGWHSQSKQLHFDLDCATPHRDRGTSLIGLAPESGTQLAEPWPDIVLAAGKSAASICRWIRKRSGGRTIIILLGRPRVAYRHFDLLVATPQFGMPEADNIAKCCLPMTWQDESRLSEEGRLWEAEWRDLPRPWTAVMVGGSTAQMTFDDAAARRLLDQLAKYASRHGGSFLVTTSPRTPRHVTDLLERHVPKPNYTFAWQPNVANPLQGMLALADSFVVTIDSVSMVAEAANRLKPLYYFSLPRHGSEDGPRNLSWSQRLRRRRQNRQGLSLSPDLLDRVADLLAVTGYVKPRNDYTSFESILRRNGIARPLDRDDGILRPPVMNIVRLERLQVADQIMGLWNKASTAEAGLAG